MPLPSRSPEQNRLRNALSSDAVAPLTTSPPVGSARSTTPRHGRARRTEPERDGSDRRHRSTRCLRCHRRRSRRRPRSGRGLARSEGSPEPSTPPSSSAQAWAAPVAGSCRTSSALPSPARSAPPRPRQPGAEVAERDGRRGGRVAQLEHAVELVQPDDLGLAVAIDVVDRDDAPGAGVSGQSRPRGDCTRREASRSRPRPSRGSTASGRRRRRRRSRRIRRRATPRPRAGCCGRGRWLRSPGRPRAATA